MATPKATAQPTIPATALDTMPVTTLWPLEPLPTTTTTATTAPTMQRPQTTKNQNHNAKGPNDSNRYDLAILGGATFGTVVILFGVCSCFIWGCTICVGYCRRKYNVAVVAAENDDDDDDRFEEVELESFGNVAVYEEIVHRHDHREADALEPASLEPPTPPPRPDFMQEAIYVDPSSNCQRADSAPLDLQVISSIGTGQTAARRGRLTRQSRLSRSRAALYAPPPPSSSSASPSSTLPRQPTTWPRNMSPEIPPSDVAATIGARGRLTRQGRLRRSQVAAFLPPPPPIPPPSPL